MRAIRLRLSTPPPGFCGASRRRSVSARLDPSRDHCAFVKCAPWTGVQAAVRDLRAFQCRSWLPGRRVSSTGDAGSASLLCRLPRALGLEERRADPPATSVGEEIRGTGVGGRGPSWVDVFCRGPVRRLLHAEITRRSPRPRPCRRPLQPLDRGVPQPHRRSYLRRPVRQDCPPSYRRRHLARLPHRPADQDSPRGPRRPVPPDPQRGHPVTAGDVPPPPAPPWDFLEQVAALAPIFCATPGGSEFFRPTDWRNTPLRDLPALRSMWKPGMALCAVTGDRLAVVDVDPRNGG